MEAKNRISRSCVVMHTADLGPHMRRLVVGGQELQEIFDDPVVSAPAAWVKLFPPGIPGRAYTISSVDFNARTLALDFVVHGDQPATVSTWARDVQAGATLEIAGPRDGGFSLLPDTRWIWLAADATALPAVQNIIESLPEGLSGRAVLKALAEAQPQPISSKSSLDVRWVDTAEAGGDMGEVGGDFDPALAQVWLAGESSWIKGWKAYWTGTVGLEPRRVAAKGYWKAGEIDYRD
ncbi:Iron import ATP-binding/permease protein IrtA [Achromobacter xylosoxidans]|uniref:siderophore-interacting protein n=1 Tax=Alcaligenes xylosoxydans xylosoxydans TaxID=85698 RepID=UPI0012AA8ABE|nr:siderophore-interacting protein [Achromobacter xylosoxidans]CUR72882.1 Iron import ATP-binding/permease protein IrtA [Achromobacter xylosoxidans]